MRVTEPRTWGFPLQPHSEMSSEFSEHRLQAPFVGGP
jgi:hypothetical protein